MTTYIRNYLDHPSEDTNLSSDKSRNSPTLEEISQSIENMMKILKNNFNISKNEAYELVLNLENEEEK